MTAPAYACEARTTGPLVRSSTRSNAFTSSLRVVKGIGAAITLNPLACKGRMTLLQLEPSAHAPWTITMIIASFLPFIRHLNWLRARHFGPEVLIVIRHPAYDYH